MSEHAYWDAGTHEATLDVGSGFTLRVSVDAPWAWRVLSEGWELCPGAGVESTRGEARRAARAALEAWALDLAAAARAPEVLASCAD